MKRETRDVFVADDGTVFDNENACEKYEQDQAERMKRTTYWRVRHNPDLTEGRGWYGATYIECYGPTYCVEAYVLDWCYRKFGRPIAFVQGVSPVESWRITRADVTEFRSPRPQRVGDYNHEAATVRLVVGPKEAGLVEEKREASDE